MSALKHIFTELVEFYGSNENITSALWDYIERQYSGPNRHYHNLDHIQNMCEHLKETPSCIIDFDTVLFAAFWHDIIYNPLRKDNEEKSAVHARRSLKKLNFPEFKIDKCCKLILATKNHNLSNDNDTNFFTDVDLVILGKDPDIYFDYTEKIRKEYHMFPKMIYNKGRQKVLEHLLSKKKIYKTEYYYCLYERPARENIKSELNILSNF